MTATIAPIGSLVIGSFLLLALSGCAPNFTMPGDDGGKAPRSVRGVTYDVGRVTVTAPACGQEYFVAATARQQLFACRNYDFTPLYERARAAASYQASLIRCPAACPGPHTWEAFRRWECADFFNPIVAYAVVEVGALCPREGDARPAGLDRPTAVELGSDRTVPGGTAPHNPPAVIEEIGTAAQVACNTRESALFEYAEPVAACRPLNYLPIVQRAEALARTYHDSVSCAPGCNRQPYRTLHRAWDCNETRPAQGATPAQVAALISVHFEVDCR